MACRLAVSRTCADAGPLGGTNFGMGGLRMWRCLTLLTLAVPLALGCREARDERPTYAEALEAHRMEHQKLERLKKEGVATEQRFEAAKEELRAIEAERKAVGREDHQRLMKLDPDQAAEYLDQRRTGDARVAKEVREGIAKLTRSESQHGPCWSTQPRTTSAAYCVRSGAAPPS